MAFLRAYQLDVMLYMSGVCGILAFMTLMTEALSRRRKSILALMELAAMSLLLFDRAAYLYRGDPSELGFVMVRLSNGMVFFLSIFVLHLVTLYLKDLYRNEGGLPSPPRALLVCELLFYLGTLLIVVSQFTGLYYSFDAQNLYRRSDGYPLSYVVPVLIVSLQELTLLRYRSRLNAGLVRSLMLSTAVPMLMSVVQVFCYGVSLTSITMVFVVTVFYLYALKDLGRAVARARQNELASYREAERREAAMFEQTAEALAGAIDAKDRYTHGHSTKVAALSRRIAEEAGFPERDCDHIYFAALLHDVGKIGVPDGIINKVGRLTDAEFEQIKRHPILGCQILSNIRQSPQLSVGAHYHHERYDGTGYPDGLRGGEIPEIARIIAVADAYDAMTSDRSYRGQLSPEKTRQELLEGRGKQFDPKYADLLLRILDGKKAEAASSSAR